MAKLSVAKGKSDRPLTVVRKTFQPMNVTGGLGMTGYKSTYRAPTVQTKRGYTAEERDEFYGGGTRRPAAPAVPALPPATGTETVVRPGVPGGQQKVIRTTVSERLSPVARPASAPARQGPLSPAQRQARRQEERGMTVAGPSGRSTGRIGVRTGGVAPGTGGRMTKAQRDAPAGPRGGSSGRVGTRTGGVAAGTGGRQTRSQRDAPAGPRGSRM